MGIFNQETLQAYLIAGCKCKHLGKPIAQPYASQDDMLDEYESETGRIFSVPEPDNQDGTYSDFIVEIIIDINDLNPSAADIDSVALGT